MNALSVDFLNAVSQESRQADLHNRITRRAWELWASYNRPAGREAEIWREAECEVLGALAEAAFFPAADDPASQATGT